MTDEHDTDGSADEQDGGDTDPEPEHEFPGFQEQFEQRQNEFAEKDRTAFVDEISEWRDEFDERHDANLCDVGEGSNGEPLVGFAVVGIYRDPGGVGHAKHTFSVMDPEMNPEQAINTVHRLNEALIEVGHPVGVRDAIESSSGPFGLGGSSGGIQTLTLSDLLDL